MGDSHKKPIVLVNAPNYPNVVIPRKETLKKYGLSEEEFLSMLDRQEGVCAICKKVPTTGRLVIDHRHVKNWKKLPDHLRKREVRGLLCHFDNHYTLARSVNVEKAKNLVKYLEEFDKRHLEEESKSMPMSVLPTGEIK